MRTLIKNVKVLTHDAVGVTVLDDAYLGIDGALIDYVGNKEPKVAFDTVKDMSGKILLPGLINGHTHSPMTLLRGIGSGLPLDRWLNEAVFPIEDKLTPKMTGIGTRLAIAEMVATGTTCFSDMYMMTEPSIEQVCNAKIKANLTRALFAFDPEEGIQDNFRFKEFMDLYTGFDKHDDGRILIDFSMHAEYTSTQRSVREYSDVCKDNEGHMHIHLSETKKEHAECKERYGVSPAKFFLDCGTFDSSCQAAHCVVVEDEDIEILVEKNVTVVHNPSSNMKIGSGHAPMAKLLDSGLNVSIGTYGAASNNNLNMFEEVHLASIIHKGYHNDPTLLKPQQLLKMATSNGAKMMRRDDIGSLEVGKKADIIAVDLDRVHLIPNLDTLALLVYSAQGSDVVMTMTDGQVIYENGVYHTIDIDRLKHDVRQVVKELY